MDCIRTCVLSSPPIERGLTGSILMKFMPDSPTLLYSFFVLNANGVIVVKAIGPPLPSVRRLVTELQLHTERTKGLLGLRSMDR